MRRWTDFLILAPLSLEIQALREALKFPLPPTGTWDHASYWSMDLRGSDERQIHIEVVQLQNQGILNTGVFSTKLILDLQPWCVVSFGIAGGFTGDDIGIGDVLVPQEVIYYEPAKETRNKKSRTSNHSADSRRQSRMKPYVVDERIHRLCVGVGRASGVTGSGTLRTYPLASGEKLISDVDAPTRQAITDINDKIFAVEMEAAGVAAAVTECASLVATKLLVVKGISDDAGKGKRAKSRKAREVDETNRKVAAKNAANLLAETIKSACPDYEHLTPQRVERAALDKRTQHFCSAIPEHLGHPINPIEAKRILRNTVRLPPVYYHWRILHGFFHWLDFCYLLVLRKLHDCGLPVYLLVTDDSEVTEAAKTQTRSIIDAVFLNSANVKWYSEMTRDRDTYIGYAASQGFFGAIDDAVGEMSHDRGQTAKEQTRNWLYYIAWSAQPSRRCVVLAWDSHLHIYKQLMHVLSIDCLIVTRQTLTLGGKDGKRSEPGKSIVIDPPCYGSIMTWLNSSPNPQEIMELGKYLSLGLSPNATDEDIKQLLQGRNICLDDVKRSDSLRILLGTLAAWNKTYFRQYPSGLESNSFEAYTPKI